MKATSEKFVKVWAEAFNNGHNIAWVARELGLSHASVGDRAAVMRKRGIDLPELSKYKASEAKRLNGVLKRELES